MSITITARCTHSNQVSCLKAVILETVAGGFDPGVWSLVALVTIDAYALWTESASGGQGEMRERTRRGKRKEGVGERDQGRSRGGTDDAGNRVAELCGCYPLGR